VNASTTWGTPLSPEEMAAVVIAVTLLRAPRPALPEVADETPPWRFSGRRFGSSLRFS